MKGGKRAHKKKTEEPGRRPRGKGEGLCEKRIKTQEKEKVDID